MSSKTNTIELDENSQIFVAGHRGMVGSAMVRLLEKEGYKNIITRTHLALDLTDQGAVEAFFRDRRIDFVFLAAARVGGIHANNTYPAEFIYQNLMIQNNVIHQAFKAGVKNLLFLGSSCIYPKNCPQPMKEEHLLSGYLEPTNEPYAIAKITGIKMCEAYNRQYGTRYYSVMPTNLFGPGDNYHLENSHVIPAMIRKFHLAKLAVEEKYDEIARDEQKYGVIPQELLGWMSLERRENGLVQKAGDGNVKVPIWGTGKALREFLHVDDMVSASLFVLKGFSSGEYRSGSCSFFNIGSGEERSIEQVALEIARIVGFKGGIFFDERRPDGTPRKLLDTRQLTKLGWEKKIDFAKGLELTYRDYLGF